jgi:hypothetical protein
MVFNAPSLSKCNLVAVAVFGFVMIGLVAIMCITFGVYEIAVDDSIFYNKGLGEVLTILGLYFAVPYLFILGTFLVVTFDVKCGCLARVDPHYVMMLVVLGLVVLQQCVTNAYLYVLLGQQSLYILIADVLCAAAFAVFRMTPASGFAYVVLYALKMSLQWNTAYETMDEPFFGPNGAVTMLFLCIPIVQLPLYIAAIAQDSSENLVDIFVSNFNLFLGHLLHSLDVISMYLFAFTAPKATVQTESCPAPFKWLLLIFTVAAFISNNVGVLHLFFRRQGGADAEIPFLPQSFRDATHGADDNTAHTAEKSQQRRMFQYLLLMLIMCDVPFFVARLLLWSGRYYPLDIFIAKNIKAMVDVLALLMRTDKQRERLAFD